MSFIEDEEAFGVFEQGQGQNGGLPLEEAEEREPGEGLEGDMEQEGINELYKGRNRG